MVVKMRLKHRKKTASTMFKGMIPTFRRNEGRSDRDTGKSKVTRMINAIRRNRLHVLVTLVLTACAGIALGIGYKIGVDMDWEDFVRKITLKEEKAKVVTLTVRNPWDRVRYVCDQLVLPGKSITINATVLTPGLIRSKNMKIPSCMATMEFQPKHNGIPTYHVSSSTRLFAIDPPLVGTTTMPKENNNSTVLLPTTTEIQRKIQNERLPMVYVRYNDPERRESYSPLKKTCDTPCVQAGQFRFRTHEKATFEDTPFQFTKLSMEGPGYYSHLKNNPQDHWRKFLSATTSFRSDVPLTYYSMTESSEKIESFPAADFDTAIKGASFLARNCNSRNKRESLLEDLIDAAEFFTNNATRNAIAAETERLNAEATAEAERLSNSSIAKRLSADSIDDDASEAPFNLKMTRDEAIAAAKVLRDSSDDKKVLSNNATTTKLVNVNSTLQPPPTRDRRRLVGKRRSVQKSNILLDPTIYPPPRFRIDSLSSCKNHAPYGFPKGTSRNSKKDEIQRHYLFHLAFENHNAEDYITEKLWGTFKSGSIPVYFGAPNIKERLPHPNSVILASDFALPEDDDDNSTEKYRRKKHNINATALTMHLIEVAHNRTLYESYHAWRQKDNPEFRKFLDTFEFTRTDFFCRLCRIGYALQYGWGWNHAKQTIRGLHPLPLPSSKTTQQFLHQPNGYNRSTCFGSDDQMIFPLLELWRTPTTKKSNHPVDEILCNSGDGGMTPQQPQDRHHQPWHSRTVGSYNRQNKQSQKFVRILRDHDGVTDMELLRENPTTAASYFQLVTPFGSNAFEVIFIRRHVSFGRDKEYENLWNKKDQNRQKRIVGYEASNRFWETRGTLVWIQYGKSRIVLMADAPNVVVTKGKNEMMTKNNETDNKFYEPHLLKEPGTIEIELPEGIQKLRLRWLVEDVDTFGHHTHEGEDGNRVASEYLEKQEGEAEFLQYGKETYFSSLMVDEFFHPPDAFQLVSKKDILILHRERVRKIGVNR